MFSEQQIACEKSIISYRFSYLIKITSAPYLKVFLMLGVKFLCIYLKRGIQTLDKQCWNNHIVSSGYTDTGCSDYITTILVFYHFNSLRPSDA